MRRCNGVRNAVRRLQSEAKQRGERQMARKPSQTNVVIPLSFAGLSIGILSGLSVSPVIATVLSAVLAVCCAAVAAFSGLREPSEENHTTGAKAKEGTKPKLPLAIPITPVPVAVFSTLVAIGAVAGVVIRTHEWLAPSPDHLRKKWVAIGVDPKVAAERLFEARYPGQSLEPKKSNEGDASQRSASASSHGTPNPTAVGISALMSLPAEECLHLTQAPLAKVRSAARVSTSAALRTIAEEIEDPKIVRSFALMACDRQGK